MNRLGVIIPTKERSDRLRQLLLSISKQKILPEQIIIIDSSKVPDDKITKEFANLNILYKQIELNSLTKQRNFALGLLKNDINLVCFLDDDILLIEDALENMLFFWEKAPFDLGGAVFNIINERKTKLWLLKQIFLTGSRRPGVVLPSGFNSKICSIEKTVSTQWLFGGATVWRRKVFDEFKFDEWFDGYGFCEDLDFSYRVAKKYKLCALSNAKVLHKTVPLKTNDSFQFGISEVKNRFYFINKDLQYFSKFLFYYASFGKVLENTIMGILNFNRNYIKQVLGNLVGLNYVLFNWKGERRDY